MRVRGVAFGLVVALLLGPALALSVVRWLQPSAGRAVRTVSFTPLAIPLYAAALVLLLVALVLVLRRSERRRSATVVVTTLTALVAAGGLLLHGAWFAPQLVGDRPDPGEGETPVRVMSVNLYEGRADTAALFGHLLREDVDVLVAAEISPEALAELDDRGLAELLPYRLGRPDGTVTGTMVFARAPITEPVQLGTGHQSWALTLGGSLRLLAAHPVAPVEPAAWRRDHRRIRAAAAEYDADLIVGDLNATADHRPLQRLEEAGYRDAAELTNQGWQPTWPANGLTPVQGLRLPPLVAIDHVLVGEGWTALDVTTLDVDGTDHRVLLAEVAPR